MNIPANTPVLVGIGTATRREENFERALEPMDLMLEAVSAAGADASAGAGAQSILAGVQHIAVSRGRWTYRNPAGEIGRAIGADRPTTLLASVGVLQQTLIGEACARIARGEVNVALVTGADAGYRLLRAQIAGATLGQRDQDDAPDIYLSPKDELRHPAEIRAGMQMPVGLYAIMESALRARQGLSVAEHRDALAELGERFSHVAAANPHAWSRRIVGASDIREASDRNPMQAFPYTRAHCSTWNVDQAAALLFCSAGHAEALGVARSRWIFPVASTESNHMIAVSARADLTACPGARLAGTAALDAGGIGVDDLDLVELYSCFPLAVQSYARALGLSLERELTVTGGMAFAGGPYNNYVLQATARAAELLRAGKGRNALVSSVSGVLTKQGFGLWSTLPGKNGFVSEDVTAAVAAQGHALNVVEDYSGDAVVAGFTVMHGRGKAPRGAALVDTPDGRRAMTTTEDTELIARMERQEFVGRTVHCIANELIA